MIIRTETQEDGSDHISKISLFRAKSSESILTSLLARAQTNFLFYIDSTNRYHQIPHPYSLIICGSKIFGTRDLLDVSIHPSIISLPLYIT